MRQSHPEDRDVVRSDMEHWQSVHCFRYFQAKQNSLMQSALYLRHLNQMVLLLRQVYCASSMSLMSAGVPIKAAVAGISCGLVTGDTDDDYLVLTDIQGLEDFFGDMDFKVAGTHKGITAIQMDIKIHGLTRPIIEEAIAKTRKARLYIIDEVMNQSNRCSKSTGWRICSKDRSDADRSTEDRRCSRTAWKDNQRDHRADRREDRHHRRRCRIYLRNRC